VSNLRQPLPFRCAESTFRALAVTFVPEAEQLRDADWAEVYRIISAALAPRPAAITRQLSVFVRVLNLRSWLRYRRPLARLGAKQRAALLGSIERSRVALLRKGLWGLRTLIFMGFYARADAAAQIGYRASARGWQRDSA